MENLKKALQRNDNWRFNQPHLILEALQAVYPYQPTRDELQVLARIRRKVFIRKLNYLINSGLISRNGHGVKKKPFRFNLTRYQQLTPQRNTEKKPQRIFLMFV